MKIKKYQPTLSLKPTQFSVGQLEVGYKVIELKKMRRKKLQKTIKETPIPVVISPWKEVCAVDHHHFLFACWEVGVKKVKVKVIDDFSKSRLSYLKFWRKLQKENLAYLYDQFGNGPQNPLYLPMDVRGMADDPYRSLAWITRKEGGYENCEKTFVEFQWANFFRKRKLLHKCGRKGFRDALGKALKLARSPAARKLPGFINSKKKNVELKDVALKKSKYVGKSKKSGDMATESIEKSE